MMYLIQIHVHVDVGFESVSVKQGSIEYGPLNCQKNIQFFFWLKE